MNKGSIKVGVIMDLTGPLSILGLASANVTKMVIDDINGKGGLLGRHVELLLEDSATTDSVAAAKAALAEQQTYATESVPPAPGDGGGLDARVAHRDAHPDLVQLPLGRRDDQLDRKHPRADPRHPAEGRGLHLHRREHRPADGRRHRGVRGRQRAHRQG